MPFAPTLTPARSREAALREVLDLISHSRGDEAPVFDAILKRAAALCGAHAAALVMGKAGDRVQRLVGQYGMGPGSIAVYDRGEVPMNPDTSLAAHAILTGKVVHIPDMIDTDGYRSGVSHYISAVRDTGVRTNLFVPLLAASGGIGCFIIFRTEVQPYTVDEIALVETFAAQAVIAVENAQQFREVQTRLEREKASAEILELISKSRDDAVPVFDAILQRVADLCEAQALSLILAKSGDRYLRMVASQGFDPATVAYYQGERPMDPEVSSTALAILTGKTIHIEDMAETEGYRAGVPAVLSIVHDSGIRSDLIVPLMSATGGIGAIVVSRKEVRPFTLDEIGLIESFAAQAVIAIENVEQFREVQTRLAREKASAEILELISQSRDDETPVFEAILRRAAELCDTPAAALVMAKVGDPHIRLVAHYGVDPETVALFDRGEVPMDPETSFTAQAILSGKVVHVDDMSDTDNYRRGVKLIVTSAQLSGVRSIMYVPLVTATGAIGCIDLFRHEVRPYTPDEIALVETFAAQAVIAIENVRQFRELQTRLAREAATREILEVISQSRDDDAPVFDAVLRNANRLCGTSMAYLVLGRPDNMHMTLAAYVNPYLPAEDSVEKIIAFANQSGMRMDAAEHFSAQAIISGEVVQIADLATSPGYLSGEPTVRILVEDVGVRTILSVPMFDAQGAIGAISLQRREERLFSDDEITLIKSFAAQASIAIENVRQFRALQTQLEREKASGEILEVISQSRDDDALVFDVIAQNAARLCGAAFCSFWRVKDGLIHYCASHGFDGAILAEVQAMPATPLFDNTLTGQVVKTRAVVRIEDATDQSYFNHEWARARGLKQFVGVPIFVGDDVWGSITLMWPADRAPQDADVALVESFAAQASIAIENVRQFRELQTRLEREAATRDILSVISQSRDDDAPVFDVIVRNAARLCNAPMAWLMLAVPAPRTFMIAGYHGLSRRQIELGDLFELDADPDAITGVGRAIFEAQTNQDEDLALTRHYLNDIGDMRMLVNEEGIRTRLNVPLVSGGAGIGAILLTRREVAPFAPDQIALVETFAAQAVIAIENVRQFRELQVRLEREKASAEILEVISQSRDDERPVFDAVLRNAVRLCGAKGAGLLLGRKEGPLLTLAALHETGELPEVGLEAVIAKANGTQMRMDPSAHISAQAICEGAVVQVSDLTQSPNYLAGHPTFRIMVEEQGMHAVLSVPLMGVGGAIGAINLHWSEVRGFTPDEIALVETFAAQAVIAIENVRQFRELQNSLEKQEATSDILRLISQSREDEGQVFDLVLEKAAVLCDADQGSLIIVNEARTHVRLLADRGHDRTAHHPGIEFSLDQPLSIVPTIRTAKVVHIEDYAQSDAYKVHDPIAVGLVEIEGVRTRLNVPLLQNGVAIGCISLSRRVVRSFSQPEIALVETFAAQAVIAIENVRQFRELQTRLEREKASAEILEVISQSRNDEAPVFDVILQNIARLCGTSLATLNRISLEGSDLEYAAHLGVEFKTFDLGRDRWPLDSTLQIAQSVREARTIHTPDLADTDLYRSGDPFRVRVVDEEGVRSYLTVPLITADRRAIGCIGLYRQRFEPFADDQIALVETFAAQAVIAIENVRQFRELQTRLAREAATREILEVISQNRDDDRPVFDVVLRKAAELCHASMAGMNIISEDRSYAVMVAEWGDHVTDLRPVGETRWPMDSDHAPSKCMRDGQIVHVHDLADSDLYRSGDSIRTAAVDNEGIRTFLAVPMFSGGKTVSCITVYRREVHPFTFDEIALVETFAAQAVIAIEKTRQFRELQDRLAREAATRDILEVISQSRDDDGPVFETILQSASRLCKAQSAAFLLANEARTHARLMAIHGDTLNVFIGADSALDAGHTPTEAIRTGQCVHIADVRDTDLYRNGDTVRVRLVEETGLRSSLAVPLMRGGEAIGAIVLHRLHEVRPFSTDDIDLLQGFAAQAVIAIENVRQFRELQTANAELQTRLAREAATREILEVISQSRDNDRPVLNAILRSVTRLCGADSAALLLGAPDGAQGGPIALRHLEGPSPLKLDLFEAEINRVPMQMDPSQNVWAQSISTSGVVQIADLSQSEGYLSGDESFRMLVEQQGVRTKLSVPLFHAGRAIGAISVHRREVRLFTEDETTVVASFAAQAVIAIENVRQFKALEALNAELGERVQEQVGEIERMGRLKRFLPAAVADAVVSSGSEKMLSSHRALLGVLFCDIRGFTAFCETAEPEETIEVLQTYHEEMGKLIEGHGAGVDHRMGDGIMVLFNDPLPCDDPAGTAVRLGLAMRDRMAELCRKWKKLGHRLGFGVGVSLGYATVGMVGSGGRIDYTASGTAINLASRLSDEAQDGEILLSPRARLAVEDDFAVEPRGEITLKGMREPVEVYRVTGVI